MKFQKPHWPPVISAEEREKRRRFQESLEEDGSEATPSTSKQWPLKVKTAKVPAWRRRATEDKGLKQGRATARRRDPKGYPCRLCGKPKRLEFGHSFCATAAGRSVSDWLSEQRRLAAADNVRDVPRTTAWRRKKRRGHC
ncbi:hypothetical protein DPX16_8750 [Anabarilius grahami]|uniref:Uncharacterized protein n=1 Tax=Anabarilius grahami TaxID=495550 RepID=A0A3N0YEX8_ANAGA|nr:hypothetical protein DPX16_8750 [Anabarilius grahami]